MRNKLKSAKLWITIWSMALTSYIIIADRQAFIQIATVLATVPLAYLGVNTWQKKILTEKKEDN